jgi:hypothetical protein
MAHQRAALAEERLSELKAILEDMRLDRDAWLDHAQRLALPPPEPTRTLALAARRIPGAGLEGRCRRLKHPTSPTRSGQSQTQIRRYTPRTSASR